MKVIRCSLSVYVCFALLARTGSYGKLAGKVFRIGHMGSQARMELVEKALNVLEEIVKAGPPM